MYVKNNSERHQSIIPKKNRKIKVKDFEAGGNNDFYQKDAREMTIFLVMIQNVNAPARLMPLCNIEIPHIYYNSYNIGISDTHTQERTTHVKTRPAYNDSSRSSGHFDYRFHAHDMRQSNAVISSFVCPFYNLTH